MVKEVYIPLVLAAQKGDGEAINKLFIEVYNDIYYFTLKTVKDSDLAADITQETLIEVFNKIGDLKEAVAFPVWCRQIAYFQCTRYFRKKKDILVEEDEDGTSLFDTIQEESTEFIPDESLDQKDFKQTIMFFIDTLSEEQRSAVMMYYFDELSVGEIAQIQGVSEGTVKSRLNYARKAIKAMVEDYEKKNDIKLHTIAFLPFFKWLFVPDKATVKAPPMAMQKAANFVKSATIATTTTTTVATTTATSTGFGLGAKITAACVAAAVVIGGSATIPIIKKDGERVSLLSAVFSRSDDDSDNEDVPIEELPLEIHKGGTYYTHDENGNEVVLVGDGKIEFPEPKENDRYVYEDYEYTYCTLRVSCCAGWGAEAIDKSKTHYGPLLWYIGKNPMTVMTLAFKDCEKMIESPEIPTTVTCLSHTYKNCHSLVKAAVIPNGVIDMWGTFYDCNSLVQAPRIPESVKIMDFTFARSPLGSYEEYKLFNTTVVIDANPTSYGQCFSYIKNITVTGKTELKEELEATALN